MKPPLLAWPPSPFGHLQASQQLLLVSVIVVLGGLALAHQGIIQPQDRRRAALQQQLAMAQQQDSLLRAGAAADQVLAQVRHRLPSRKAITSLLQEISALAVAHQVTVNSATPQLTRTIGRYTQCPILVDATGTFASILQFLNALEHTAAPFRFDEVDLVSSLADESSRERFGAFPGPPDVPGTDPGQLRVRLTVSTLLGEA